MKIFCQAGDGTIFEDEEECWKYEYDLLKRRKKVINMKILYQAEDGTVFENEGECWKYEYALTYPEMFGIQFYDKNDSTFFIDKNDIFNDDVYQKAEKINIHNETELAVLHKLAMDCGWCEFDQITAPGIWIRIEEDKYGNGRWEVSNDVK